MYACIHHYQPFPLTFYPFLSVFFQQEGFSVFFLALSLFCTVCDMEWCNHHNNNNHTLLTTILNQFFLLTPLCFSCYLLKCIKCMIFAVLPPLILSAEWCVPDTHTHHNTVIITLQPSSSCENA